MAPLCLIVRLNEVVGSFEEVLNFWMGSQSLKWAKTFDSSMIWWSRNGTVVGLGNSYLSLVGSCCCGCYVYETDIVSQKGIRNTSFENDLIHANAGGLNSYPKRMGKSAFECL